MCRHHSHRNSVNMYTTVRLLLFVSTVLACYAIEPETTRDTKHTHDDVTEHLSDRELILQLVQRVQHLEQRDQTQAVEIEKLRGMFLRQKKRTSILEQAIKQRFFHTKRRKSSNIVDDLTTQQYVGVNSAASNVAMGSTIIEDDATIIRNPLSVLANTAGSISRTKKQEAVIGVAFYAILTSHATSLGVHQSIEFDHVATNLGNAYNPHTGTFMAPVSGTYVFSVSLMGHDAHNTHYYIARNTIAVCNIYIAGGQSSPYTTSSHTVVLQLTKGDDITVRNTDANEAVYGLYYSGFSGFLLYSADNPAVIIG